jgi:hypothetical protein
MLCCFLLAFCLGYAYSVEEYSINTTITAYNENLEGYPLQLGYYPGEFHGYNNPIFLYVNQFVGRIALLFGKHDQIDDRKIFIEVIDKCIEWANVAKKNAVHNVSKDVKEDVTTLTSIRPGLNGSDRQLLVIYHFRIAEFNGKEETLLVIMYYTYDEARQGYPPSYIIFKETDFTKLKEVFSDAYLKQFDDKAELQSKQAELFN